MALGRPKATMHDKSRNETGNDRGNAHAALTHAIRTILICGYGVMGQGVATTFAAAGFRTFIFSRRADSLLNLPPGVRAVARLEQLGDDIPDLAIEFAPEDVDAKQAVYRQLEEAFPGANPVIATGTSGLDLVRLAITLVRPERFVGMHYFMPADSSPVVEVMSGPQSPAALVDRVADAVEATGKDALRLYKPTIGYLVNRLQHAILHEAYYLIEAGVASAADIDRAARRLLAPRMCLNGLIQQKDISGLKIHADAQRSIVPALFHNGVPNPMLQAMVARGQTGLNAGKGFYDWTGADPERERARVSHALTVLLAFLETLDSEAGPGAARSTSTPRGA
jgi:3-hydroxybutyryl-CoA dehydrogenase